MNQQKVKVVSLFCGCGGSDLGLLGGFEYLGKYYPTLPFEIIYSLDIDKFAVQTYNANFQHSAVCDDIKNLNVQELGDFDLLLGGFPCQSFSTVNPSKDTNDARANLYKELVKVLQAKQPKYFIFENVKGLMTLQKGKILQKVLTEFEQAGYEVQYKLLLATNFGIPQRRERVFMVGVRKDIQKSYTFPTETHAEQPNLYQQPFVKLEEIITNLAIDNPKYYFSKKAVLGMKNAKNNMKRGLYQNLQGQCLTITAHLAKASLNSRDPVLLVDESQELYRRFTPREAAGIQSFPDTFQFPVSDIQAYRQIGNAIPPVLMWHVANALAEIV